MKNFRTYDFAKQFYHQAKNINLRGPARDQFQRALLSVCLNLAEGSGRPTAKDRARFYAIALGSLREVQTLLDLNGYKIHYESADRLGAMIYCLIQNPGSAPETAASSA